MGSQLSRGRSVLWPVVQWLLVLTSLCSPHAPHGGLVGANVLPGKDDELKDIDCVLLNRDPAAFESSWPTPAGSRALRQSSGQKHGLTKKQRWERSKSQRSQDTQNTRKHSRKDFTVESLAAGIPAGSTDRMWCAAVGEHLGFVAKITMNIDRFRLSVSSVRHQVIMGEGLGGPIPESCFKYCKVKKGDEYHEDYCSTCSRMMEDRRAQEDQSRVLSGVNASSVVLLKPKGVLIRWRVPYNVCSKRPEGCQQHDLDVVISNSFEVLVLKLADMTVHTLIHPPRHADDGSTRLPGYNFDRMRIDNHSRLWILGGRYYKSPNGTHMSSNAGGKLYRFEHTGQADDDLEDISASARVEFQFAHGSEGHSLSVSPGGCCQLLCTGNQAIQHQSCGSSPDTKGRVISGLRCHATQYLDDWTSVAISNRDGSVRFVKGNCTTQPRIIRPTGSTEYSSKLFPSGVHGISRAFPQGPFSSFVLAVTYTASYFLCTTFRSNGKFRISCTLIPMEEEQIRSSEKWLEWYNRGKPRESRLQQLVV
mmetsp:Transcript_737/g.2366  ORF Transcript_737/g.2366 Transcript_737/m.2366 type:complete len:534 (-) Transcript_737:166-1767(-)